MYIYIKYLNALSVVAQCQNKNSRAKITVQFYKLDQLGCSIWKSKFMNTNEIFTTFSKVLL